MSADGPDLSKLLNQAIERHRGGDLDGADSFYGAALQRDPDNVEALQLRGALLRRRGQPAEALALLERAVRLDPQHGAAWANHGLAQRDLGLRDGAEASLARATSLHAGLIEAWLALGRLRLERGALNEAAAAAAGALRARPGHPEARLLLGLARAEAARATRQAGRAREAIALLQPIDPDEPAAAALGYELGHAWLAEGREAEAEAAWRSAVTRAGAPVELSLALGGLLLRQGRPEDAARALLPALRPPAADAPSPAWLAFVDAVGQIAAPEPALAPAIVAAFRVDGLDHQRLERAARALLAADARVAQAVAALEHDPETDLEAAITALIAHPLTAPWLSRALVQHPDWERLWTGLRAALVNRSLAGEALPEPLLEAVALQAWNTEFTAQTPPDEALKRTILARLAGAADPAPLLRRWACLAPIAESGCATGILRDAAPTLARLQLDERDEERALAAALPTIGPGGDPVSAQVRAQYEDNPYPRLVAFQRRAPQPLPAVLRAALPTLRDLPELAPPLSVLVAGCGTGQHALTAATRYAGAQVTAIDLSRASLGRAARLAARWGLDNLRFVAADLLDVAHLGQRWSIVESVGVLHHLDRPAAGLAALVEVTEPGGLLLLGLYSERGRQDVVAARALIAEHGWPATPEGIRAARAAIAALPADHPARPVLYSADFASLSGTRDLLFHVAEQRFTPPGLAALIQGAGLEFLGFQHSRPEAPARYRARWPEDPEARDLSRWDQLEAEHPRLFSGMYVFWCRKAASAAPIE